MINKLIVSLFLCLLSFSVAVAQQADSGIEAVVETTVVDSSLFPAPVSNLQAVDTDNDHGHSVTITWELSPDDDFGKGSVLLYDIFRWMPFERDTLRELQIQLANLNQQIREGEGVTSETIELRDDTRKNFNQILNRLGDAFKKYPENGQWVYLGKVPMGTQKYVDVGHKDNTNTEYLPDFTDFYYRVDAVTVDSTIRTSSEVFGPVQSYGQWFNKGRIPVFVAVIIFGILTFIFVTKAKKGAELYVRPMAGIEAVDDAIGRATEMGRPILYVLGLGTAADVATIASFTILSRVAKRVAEYQTKLIVPTYDPIVMTVAQEVVKSAYMDAGRPEAYDEDIVHFVTQLQFAYVAAVNGTMLRELPATNVYMGKFFAESLLLAETGAVAGSIQISGTDEIAQIPFFIVACDYTLIGEELYAASAYLGREPVLLGSLKAQDYAKAVLIILAIVGLLAANIEWTTFTDLFQVTN